jgi:hypothetical protein
MCEETERMQRDYGSNPKWQKYLEERASHMEKMRSLRRLPMCGSAEAKKLPYWPYPAQMVQQLSGDRKRFLTYLNDWYYKELSSADHLSFGGLVIRAAPLMDPDDTVSENRLHRLRSYWFATTVTLVAAILSEIQIEAGFGFASRLQYVWRILSDADISKEIYDLRYKAHL